MKIKQILTTSLLMLLLTTTSVNAEELKIKTENDKINLIEVAEVGDYSYSISDDYAIFHLENDLIKIIEDSPFIEINGVKKLIETEKMSGIVLPKYSPIDISEKTVELNFDFLSKNTKLKTENKSIIINKEKVEIKKPQPKDIKKLDLDYINERISELGYDYNGNYMIDGELLQTINTGSNYLKITTLNETEFQKNNGEMSDLLVETILKLALKDDYSGAYNHYISGNSMEKTYGDLTVSVWTEGDSKFVKITE